MVCWWALLHSSPQLEHMINVKHQQNFVVYLEGTLSSQMFPPQKGKKNYFAKCPNFFIHFSFSDSCCVLSLGKMKTNNFLLMLYVWLYPQNRAVPKLSATSLQDHSRKDLTLLLGRAYTTQNL